MILFYSPVITDQTFELPPEESKHCIRVLRMQAGDKIMLTDGSGYFYYGEITNPDPRKCLISIIDKRAVQKTVKPHIHLAVAPTKNIARYEWFLEKATEIGIDEITPLICTNSERTVIKTDRLNKVIIAAMKQSVQAWKPVLNEAISFEKFMKLADQGDHFIPYVSSEPLSHLASAYKKGNDCTILIGPEGDFTIHELQLAADHGFIPVSLGENRLRTETAAVVACHIFNLINRKQG